jgi:radical SAM enzyme (TIGR01210 family)
MNTLRKSSGPINAEYGSTVLGTVMKRLRVKRRGSETKSFFYEDRLSKGKGKVLEIILSSTGCYWAKEGGCTFCGFIYDTGSKKNPSQEFLEAYQKYSGEAGPIALKLYTSGSFFDPREVKDKDRNSIIEAIAKDERIKDVVVESRPEFVQPKIIGEFADALCGKNLEVGIGLETSNDSIRENCINKGFTRDQFVRASGVLRDYKIGTRAYLFVKPIFLTEKEALEDMKKSTTWAAKYSSTISFNFAFVFRDTLMDLLFARKEYRPPWLWTGLEILDHAFRTKKNISQSMLGAGSPRGVHNCGSCDRNIIDKIKLSILEQKPMYKGIDCKCREEWEGVICTELLP